MVDLLSTEEFMRFERKWKIIFTFFGAILAGTLLDYLLRSPRGVEAFWCYTLGAAALLVCLWSAHKLGDAERYDGAIGGLELLGEDLPISGPDD
ncbi:hypothetical protein ACN9MZ_15270 [Pseudoduganella sp. S-14]|uniref:hypothetical protein n=1 Tax=Pseudoduganella sp. S-14 TaxID=3404065 RepID=UPI003CE70EC0